MRETTRGHLAALYTITVWALTFVSTKILLRTFSAIDVTILRTIIAYISLFFLSPKPVRFESVRREFPFALAGALGVTGYMVFQNIGLASTSATNSSIILNTAPLFIIIFNGLLLKDRSGWHRWFFIGFVLAITGISMITLDSSGVAIHLRGDLLTVCAAAMWGFYTLVSQTLNKRGLSVLAVTRRVYFWGLVWMIPFMFLFHFHPSLASLFVPANLINLLFLGVFASGLCFVSWNYTLKKLGTVKASIYIYGQPVISVIASIFILSEQPTLQIVGGIILSIIGVIISGITPRRAA